MELDPLERALQDHGDVGRARRGLAAGIEDRAEQEQLGAGEGIADLDLLLRHVGHESRLRLAEEQGGEQPQQDDPRPPHSICTV